MKRNIFKTFAFCAALLALSCQKDRDLGTVKQDNQPVTYNFEIGGEAVKSYVGSADDCMQWEQDDMLGYILVKQDGSDVESSKTPIYIGGVRPGFGITPTKFEVTQGDILYTWYEFQEGKYEIENLTSARCFNLPASQEYKAGKFTSSLPLVGEPYTFKSNYTHEDGNVELPVIHFSNLYSLLEFKVYSTSSKFVGETVKSITIDAPGASLAGDFKMDVKSFDPDDFITLDFTAPASEVTVSTDVKVAADNTGSGVLMAVMPGTYTGGKITVVTDKATYVKDLAELTFARSGKHPLGLNLDKTWRTPASPETLYMVDDQGGVFNMAVVSGSVTHYRTTSSTSSMAGSSFKFATKVENGQIAQDAVVFGYKNGAVSSDADAEFIPLDPVYSMHGGAKPHKVGVDFSTMKVIYQASISAAAGEGSVTLQWVTRLPQYSEVVFNGFSKPVSQMLNTAVFDNIDDAASTARYIGVSDAYETWYRPTEGWILFNNSISTTQFVIIGKGASFPQSPYMDWPMSPADFLLTTGQALPLYNIQENIYRTEAYLTKDFEIQFYSAHAWANSITDWTSTTATKHTEGSLAWITPLDKSTFVEGVYTIEYNSSTKVVKITKK